MYMYYESKTLEITKNNRTFLSYTYLIINILQTAKKCRLDT